MDGSSVGQTGSVYAKLVGVKRIVVDRAERAGQDSAIPWCVAAAWSQQQAEEGGKKTRGTRRGVSRDKNVNGQMQWRARTLGMEVSGWRETNGALPKKLDSLRVLNVGSRANQTSPNQTVPARPVSERGCPPR
jgi:hypothetical protein